MPNRVNLFVYGTLMDSMTRNIIIGRLVDYKYRTLKGFERGKLSFNPAYPTIYKQQGKSVKGMILENLTFDDMLKIVKYETDMYKIESFLDDDYSMIYYFMESNGQNDRGALL